MVPSQMAPCKGKIESRVDWIIIEMAPCKGKMESRVDWIIILNVR